MTALEITLRSLKVIENGELAKRKSKSVLTAELFYPRPNTPYVASAKVVALVDAERIDLLNGKKPGTDSKYGYVDRMLFKEELAGLAALRISVTTTHEKSSLDKFLAGLYGGLVGAMWKAMTGSITTVFGKVAAEAVQKTHTSGFAAEDATFSVGEAYHELDATLPDQTLSLKLTVPARVEFATVEMKYGKPKHATNLLLKKGSENGVIEVDIKQLH